MKKVIILLVVLALLAVPTVVAVKEATVTGWYHYIDDFSFNGDKYGLKLTGGEYNYDNPDASQTSGILRISRNDDRFIVRPGECQETINHSYCFLNKSFDSEKVDIDANGNLQPAIQIKLTEYDYTSSLTITRTFEKTKFALYETGEVEITLTNTGDNLLTNIRLHESAPAGFNISWQESSLHRIGNNLSATINLYPGKTWSARYRIKAINYSKSSYTTSALYDAKDEVNLAQKSASATVEVLQPYSTTTSLPSAINRNAPAQFKLTITNNENEELSVDNLHIYIPLSIGVIGTTNLKQQTFNVFSHVGTIPAKQSKDFIVKLNTPFVGSYTISYEGEITVKGKNYSINGSKDIGITTKGMNCYFTFNEPSLQAGRNLQYTVMLKNLGSIDDYYNINGTIYTAFENISFFVPSLFRDNSQIVINKRYHMPFSTKDKEYPFRIKAKYTTTAGQVFTCDEENNYLVKGAKNILQFDIFVSADKPSPGDDVNLIVTIENELAEDIYDITIFSNTTDGDIIKGVSKKQLGFLASQEKKEMYTVTVHIPDDYAKKELDVFTTGIVDSHDYTDVQKTTIPIKLPVIEEPSNNVTIKNNSQINNEEPEPNPTPQPIAKTDEKKGFFAKVWQLLKRLW